MSRRLTIVLAVAVVVHGLVVVSILRQPLASGTAPPATRSWIWSLHNDTVHRTGPAADYFALYHAGIQVRRGASPYDTREAPQATPYFFHFRYLPIVAQTLGRVATVTSPRTSYLAWTVTLELLLVGGAVLAVAKGKGWLAVIALLSSPYFLELHMGQFTFAATVLALLAVGILEGQRTRPWLIAVATASYAAAVSLKLFPLLLAPALWRNRGGRWCVIGALAVLPLNLPFFLSQPGSLSGFISYNFVDPMAGMGSGNHGLVYVGYLAAGALGVAATPSTWNTLIQGWQIGILALAIVTSLTARDKGLLPAATLLLGAYFLSAAHVWEHHMSGIVLMGLVLIWHLTRGRSTGEHRRGLVRFALVATVILALPTPFVLFDDGHVNVWDPSGNWPTAVKLLLPASKAVPTLILAVVAAVAMIRSRRYSERTA